MPDGAHLNIGAEEGMKANIAGEEPHPMTDEEFEQMVREAPIPGDSYSGQANATAKLILEMYEEYPQTRELPEEREYLRDLDGHVDWNDPIYLNVTLYDVTKKAYPQHHELFLDLTGFMWGWAVNAARKILGLGPLPNPALMTISVEKT